AAVISASVNSNRLQQALDEAQSAAKNYAQTLQAIGSAVVVTDHRQYVTLFNPLAEEVTGHTAAEVTGKPLQECFTLRNNQSGEVDFPLIQEVLLTGKIVKTTSNTELITNSGRRCRIIGCAAPITNDEGEITGTVMTFNDATAESRRLDDLSESVALLSNIVQYSNLSFFKVDLGSKESSPLLAGKLRYCPTRGGKAIPINEWLLPEDAQNLEKLTEKLASGSIKSASIIIKTAYSGINQHFQLHMTAVHDRKPDSIVGICRDVTLEVAEQKRRDEELMLLESIVNLIPYPIFVKNAEDRFRYSHCNLSFAQLINRAQSEIIGKTDEQLLHGDDAELIRKNDRETLRKNERCEFIQEYHDQAGNLRRCQCVKQIISGVGGKKSLLGISIDVTASETVRIATEAVTRLFEAICDHLPFDLCVRDADNDFSCVIWNQSIAETRNIPKTERLHLPLSDSGNSAADFVTEERRCYQELLLSGEPYEEQKIFEHPAKSKLFRKIHRIPIHQDGRRLILEVATDNAAECKLQQTLSLYAQHDATVNRVLRTMLLEDDFSATTEKMLETYAKSISADRGFVFHLTGNRIVKE
ncbi:MAG: PAS domain-containing protein, partial [Victivallaceae bacterium]